MNNLLDSSALLSSPTMSKDDFVGEILPVVQEILNERFPGIPQKRAIKMYKDRISFAAPCCGDSTHNYSKKRGNIILSGKFANMYKCHNCGVCMSIPNFLKKYGKNISLGCIDYIHSVSTDASTRFRYSSYENVIYDESVIESYSIDREEFKNILNLSECSQFNEGHEYLIGRKQYDFSRFLYSCKYRKLFILNLTRSGKILGMQVRNMNNAYNGPKYKTYNISKIHEMLYGKSSDIPDNIVSASMIFNMFSVDYTIPVTVVEGPMDSFLIKNCIALCGAGKNVEFPFETRYMFDDDKTGISHAMDKLNEGYSVFMWDRFLSDIGMPSGKKVDMNDVIIWADKEKVKIPNLDQYFSSDELDMIDL